MVFNGTFPATELTPTPCGLLGVAVVTTHTSRATDERWIRGYNTEVETVPAKLAVVSATGYSESIMERGDLRTGALWLTGLYPFAIELEERASGLNLTPADVEARVLRQIEAGTQKAVEFELWEGRAAREEASAAPYLTMPNSQTMPGARVVSSGGVAPKRALALLEQAIAGAPLGTVGVIHVTRDVASDLGLTLNDDGTMTTSLGTPVSVGSGYTGRGPSGQADAEPTATNKWMYATGPVEVHLTAPESTTASFDSTVNDLSVKADRYAAVYFDMSIFAAAQVTLS